MKRWLKVVCLVAAAALPKCSGDVEEPTGIPGVDGAASLVETQAIEPGEECPSGGVRVTSGVDADGDGQLSEGEVTSSAVVCNGEDGDGGGGEESPVLIDIETLLPGEDCPYGGYAIHAGRDTDGDGILDEDEIDSTNVLCDDAPSAGGAPPLVDIVPEEAGEHCPSGGVAVLSGLDEDGDGALDPEEVTSTAYICSTGEGGPTTLVDIVVEPEGERCPEGGAAIRTGVDANGDGRLSDGEVQSVVYVCDGEDGEDGEDGADGSGGGGGGAPTSITGSITVDENLDLVPLASLKTLDGDLTIKLGTGLTDPAFPALESITGFLRIENATAANHLSFPKLTSVEGSLLFISTTDLVLGGVFPSLKVAGGLSLTGPQQEFTDAFPELEVVTGSLLLKSLSLSVLGAARFPKLTSVLGALQYQPSGPTDGSTWQVTVGGDVFPVLQTVGGALTVGTTAPTDVTLDHTFPTLTEIGGKLAFDKRMISALFFDDPFPRLTRVGEYYPAYAEWLAPQVFPALTEITGRFTISFPLPAYSIARQLKTVGTLYGVSRVDQASLTTFDVLERITGEISLQVATGFSNLGSFPKLTELGGFNLPYSLDLQSLGYFPKVTHIAHSLTLADGDLALFAPLLTQETMFKFLYLKRVSGLSALDGTRFASETDTIAIDSCPDVTSLSFTGLEISGQLAVGGNPLLERIEGLEGLREALRGFTISGNPALTSITGLSSLESASDIEISQNPVLERIEGLGKLRTVTYDLEISSNTALTSLGALDELESVRDFLVRDSLELEAIGGLRSLHTARSIYLRNLPKLGALPSFDSLRVVSVEVTVAANDLLVDLRGLEALESVYRLKIGQPGTVTRGEEVISDYRQPSRTSLAGLENLKTVDELLLTGQGVLTDLSAIQGLEVTETAVVSNNPMLPACDVKAFVEASGAPESTQSGNLGSCP